MENVEHMSNGIPSRTQNFPVISKFIANTFISQCFGKRQAYMLGTVTHSTGGVSIAGLDYWADLFATIK